LLKFSISILLAARFFHPLGVANAMRFALFKF